MSAVIDTLNQSYAYSVWKHFHAISQVPRGSGNEAGIRQLLIDFANDNSLEWKTDTIGNIVIYKAASQGREESPVTILQSHVDMVNEKNDLSQHDFTKDAISFVRDGDWIRADGTTLGADDGIGVAATLAILEDNSLSHGALEALFTVEEETTMAGAMEVDAALLKGRRLINIDSEDSETLTVGCAGGINLDIEHEYKTDVVPDGHQIQKITISGLKGGHSGCDIHLQRGNAILLMARVIRLLQQFKLRLISLNGGTVDNAIPRSAEAVFAIASDQLQPFSNQFLSVVSDIQSEFRSVEPDVKFDLVATESTDPVMDKQQQEQIIKALHGCINGVHRNSDDFESVVETSSNLGVYRLEKGKMTADCFIRSLVDSATVNAGERIAGHFELSGAKVTRRGLFPGWKPEPKSKLLDSMIEKYRAINGKAPKVEVIHAALECGIIGSALGGADMVSIGPIIEHPHSPDEKVHVSSVDSFYRLLVASLASD